MKYAHIIDNKLQGWYSDDIHSNIPTPNIEVTDEVWQEALNINANAYENGKFIAKDFRTPEEIAQQEQARLKAEKDYRLQTIKVTTVNGNEFDGNETARNNMLSAISSAEFIGKTEDYWKLADNSTKLVSLDELKEALALAIQEVGNIVKDY